MRPVLAVLLACGCGFEVNASGPTDAASIDDDAVDGPVAVIDAAPSCIERWLTHTIRFGEAQPITAINSTTYDRDPYLTADELTVYVSSLRAGSTGTDTWSATRATLGGAFSTPTRVTELSTTGAETKVGLTSNGLYAVLGSNQAGGAGGVDVWATTRASSTDAFGPLTRTHLLAVATGGSEHDPFISSDGLRLYLAPDQPGAQHIAVASRASATADFSAPTAIAELNSNTGDGDPTLSVDERVIVFYSNRATSVTGGNIWYAVRTSLTEPFGTPVLVPDINTSFNDGDPHLSTDGCRLYFGRDGGGTDWDIYVAMAQ